MPNWYANSPWHDPGECKAMTREGLDCREPVMGDSRLCPFHLIDEAISITR